MTYVCRLCSCSDFDKIQVTDIFGSDGIKNNLPLKINTLANILVTEDDPLPNFVCVRCTSKLDTVLAFQEQCMQAQVALWKEYISHCCARVTRLRKDVRMQAHYKHAEVLIQRATSMGVKVNCLRECLWKATKYVSYKHPNVYPSMLKQLATLPVVKLERCSTAINTNISDEIEDALPVFRITKTARRCTESCFSSDSDDEVLSQIHNEAFTPVSFLNVGELQDTFGDGHCPTRSDCDQTANNIAAESRGEELQVVNERAINCDEEILESISKQSSGNCNYDDHIDLPDVVINQTENKMPDSSTKSLVGGVADSAKSEIEVTEFIDVGLFNNSIVRVNNEVKIKEEEEPMLEFTEPMAVYHDERNENIVGVCKPLEKKKKLLIEHADLAENQSFHQPVVDGKPIKQEPLPVDNLQNLVLFSNSNTCEYQSVISTTKCNEIPLVNSSINATTQPKAVEKDELQNRVLLTSKDVTYKSTASQTTLQHPEARLYHQASGWPASSVQSIDLPASQTNSQHCTYSSNIQPFQDITAVQTSGSSMPSAPLVHCSTNGRQLPVSRVQPLTTSVRGSSAENLKAALDMGEVSHSAQLMPPVHILANVLRGPRPVVVRYPGKRHLADVSARNEIQSPNATTLSVERMQQHATNIEAEDIQHTSSSFQQVNNNSQSTARVLNTSPLGNVFSVSSNQQPTSCFQTVVSSSQPSISIVNPSLLTNVRPVSGIQQPTPAISVVNHSLENVLATQRYQQPTTAFQHVINSSKSPSSVSCSPIANVRVVSSFQQPTSCLHHSISSSHPTISVINQSSPTNVQAVPSIQQPTVSFQHSVNHSRPAISVINQSSLTNVQTVPSIKQPNASFQHSVSHSRPAISVVNQSSLINVQAVPGIQQPTSSLQSNSEPSVSVTNCTLLKNVQSISGTQHSSTNLSHVHTTQPATVVKKSLLTNLQAVPGIQQPTTSFQNVFSNSQPTISVVNQSLLSSVPSNQQSNTNFQHVINNSEPTISVVSQPSFTNVVAGTSIQHHTTSSQKIPNSSQPIISVKKFSRMTADTIIQNKYPGSTNQSSVVNNAQCTQSSSAKRTSDTSVSYQSSVGIQPKQPKLIETVTASLIETVAAASMPQAQVMSVANQNALVSVEQPIQSYSLSLKAWDSLRDESSIKLSNASSSRQDSTSQSDIMSNQSNGTHSEKNPLKAIDEMSQLSPTEVDMYKEYLKVSGKKFLCVLCKGYLDNKEKCMTHIKNHMKDSHFYCLGCRAEVPASRFVKCHLYRCLDQVPREAANNKYVCMVCQIEFHHMISLQYHYRRHMSLQKDSKYSFLCHPCGKAFVLKQDYIAHKLQVHGMEEGQEKTTCHLMCNKCKILFFTQSALDRHQAKHCSQTVDDDCQIID